MNSQIPASDESQGTVAKKSKIGVGSQRHEEGANPPERDIPGAPQEGGGIRASSNTAVPRLGILGYVKNFGKENKLIAAAIPVLAVLLTTMGMVSDFSVLVSLWGDEKASNTPAYIGIDVKDYAPAVSSFACAEGDADCLKASKNADLKSKLRAGGALRVVEVATNGPAAEAGVRTGDIVTGLDGYRLAGSVEFSTVMKEYHPGDTVRLFLYREGKDGYLKRESVRVGLK